MDCNSEVPEVILDAVRQRHEQRATDEYQEAGYSVCSICGHIQFLWSRESDASIVHASWRSCGKCPKCSEIHQRYPELSMWLMDVLGLKDTLDRQRKAD